MTKSLLTVWLLADGKPGHVNQTMGVVRALEKQFACDTHHIQVRWPLGLFRRLFQEAWRFGYRQPPAWLIQRLCGLDQLPVSPPPDLIVSAGGNTLWANAWLAKRYVCSNIFSGKLRQMPPDSYTAALTIQPSHHPNVIELDIAPNGISAEIVQKAGKDLRANSTDQSLWCLLIGGDGAGYRYDWPDWLELADGLNRLSMTHGGRWLIVTSRRTQPGVEKLLRKRIHQEILADAVWYHSGDRRKVIPKFLGASEYVFVTEASMTMSHESIASSWPVLTLCPEHSEPGPA